LNILSFLFLFFIVLLFICAYKAWVISPPCPHPFPYHPLCPLPLPNHTEFLNLGSMNALCKMLCVHFFWWYWGLNSGSVVCCSLLGRYSAHFSHGLQLLCSYFVENVSFHQILSSSDHMPTKSPEPCLYH
jgi:hypothetical protein